MHQLTGDFYTVGEVLGHTLAGIGASLGMSMNFESVTARYVDVRLERKKASREKQKKNAGKKSPQTPYLQGFQACVRFYRTLQEEHI